MKKIKLVDGYEHISYQPYQYSQVESESKSSEFLNHLDNRRSVREYSDKPVDISIIEKLILTASTAPSGAHKQPWTFCAVANPEIKSAIRKAAEEEEKESYQTRMSEEWKRDLAPLGTNMNKPFLEIAPWLIIVFKKSYDLEEDGAKRKNYYVNESVGIACGMLITAIHNAGLVTLTHTPSPMNFLSKILNRPVNEKPFLLLPVGYPITEVYVPNIERKPLAEISKFYL